jgi:hypothetical protein
VNIPFTSDIAWVPLPIDSQDLVTKVRLVVAGEPAGWESQWIQSTIVRSDAVTVETYRPRPVTFEYADAANATYGAERSFGVSPRSNPFLRPGATGMPSPSSVRVNDPGNVIDGDPETFATPTGAGGAGTPGIFYGNGVDQQYRAVGFVLMYSGAVELGSLQYPFFTPGVNAKWRSTAVENGDREEVYGYWPLVNETETHFSQRSAILPDDARFDPVNDGHGSSAPLARVADLSLQLPDDSTYTNLQVYHFYPLIPDLDLLERAAKQLIRLPHTSPKRVTVPYVVPAEASHTLVGWPGGDLTAAVARTQWIDGTTVIDFEAPGAPLTIDADGAITLVTAEAVEAERVRRNHAAEELRRGTYKLLMGR